jgi:hypothetical protein
MELSRTFDFDKLQESNPLRLDQCFRGFAGW